MELEHLASRPFAGILLEIPNSVKNQLTSPLTSNVSNELDESNSHTLTPITTNVAKNKQPSKLKAFTTQQRSHLKNFLNSSSNNSSNNGTGGDQIKLQQTSNSNFENPTHNNPTPVALEPCYNNKAAVLSLIVRLPTGGTGEIPVGQTGIAIASALVSLGPIEQKMHDNIKNNSNKKTNNPAFV